MGKVRYGDFPGIIKDMYVTLLSLLSFQLSLPVCNAYKFPTNKTGIQETLAILIPKNKKTTILTTNALLPASHPHTFKHPSSPPPSPPPSPAPHPNPSPRPAPPSPPTPHNPPSPSSPHTTAPPAAPTPPPAQTPK